MDLKIFDMYNIRARLSVYVILLTPIIVTLYALYEPIRSLSFSVISVAILSAFSNYLFAVQRYTQRNNSYKNTAAELLYPNDHRIDDCTKQRYYQRLSKIEKRFEIFNTPSESEEFKLACVSAVQWLRDNTRDNRLVQEENMLCGFYKNLLSFKCCGILFAIGAMIILLVEVSPISIITFCKTKVYLGLAAFDVLFILFWVFGVKEEMRAVLTEKYAKVLLGALDKINIQN